MGSHTEEDVVAMLRQRLGRPPLDALILDYCRDMNWISDAMADLDEGRDPEEAIDWLAEGYRLTQRLLQGAWERRVSPDSRVDPAEHIETRGDARGAALAEIFSIDAAQLPDVAAFRTEALDGRLLRREEVADWIRDRVSARTADRPRPRSIGRKRSNPPHVETVGYLLPESRWPHHVVIGTDPILRALKQVATLVVNRYGWLESEATTFILTGAIVGLPRGRAQVIRRLPWAAASTIVLEISPRTPPTEVVALYRQARRRLLDKGRRSRDLQKPARVSLAVHAFKTNGVATWRQAMKAWNEELPEGGRRYSDPRSFARDCRDAFKAVTGDKLECPVGDEGPRDAPGGQEAAEGVQPAGGRPDPDRRDGRPDPLTIAGFDPSPPDHRHAALSRFTVTCVAPGRGKGVGFGPPATAARPRRSPSFGRGDARAKPRPG